jgi:hypothetical protein
VPSAVESSSLGYQEWSALDGTQLDAAAPNHVSKFMPMATALVFRAMAHKRHATMFGEPLD